MCFRAGTIFFRSSFAAVFQAEALGSALLQAGGGTLPKLARNRCKTKR